MIAAVACLGVLVTAQAAAAEATARIVAAAQAFLATLDEAGRAKVQFPVRQPAEVALVEPPHRHVRRNGVRMGDLTPPQRAAAMAVLEAALSPDGYRKVIEIVRGDEVLRGSSGGGGRPGAVRRGRVLPRVPRRAVGRQRPGCCSSAATTSRST